VVLRQSSNDRAGMTYLNMAPQLPESNQVAPIERKLGEKVRP
jgi:hypothetical protein